VFVDLPLGHTSGAPDDPVGQRQLLTNGLAAGFQITKPGQIVDLPFRWVDDDWKASPLSWSRRRQVQGVTSESAGDTRSHRSDQPYYHNDVDREAAAGVTWDEQCASCLGIARPD